MPELLELVLTMDLGGRSESLFEILRLRKNLDAQESCLVPKLKRLKLTTPRNFPFTAFADMIYSRREITADNRGVFDIINSIELCYPRYFGSDEANADALLGISHLLAMKESGLGIRTMDANSQEIAWTSFFDNLC